MYWVGPFEPHVVAALQATGISRVLSIPGDALLCWGTASWPPPSPPPTPPPPPVPAVPPPSSPPDSTAALESWQLALIVACGAVALLCVSLICYKKVVKSTSMGATTMSTKDTFPVAIGASTTQHV